eukprot:4526780-Amphidinium_carterae.1
MQGNKGGEGNISKLSAKAKCDIQASRTPLATPYLDNPCREASKLWQSPWNLQEPLLMQSKTVSRVSGRLSKFHATYIVSPTQPHPTRVTLRGASDVKGTHRVYTKGYSSLLRNCAHRQRHVTLW